MTGVAVLSFKIRRANKTVNAGAVDLMVSTNETGTCSRAMRPRTTVRPRRMPTMDMSRTKLKVTYVDVALGLEGVDVSS